MRGTPSQPISSLPARILSPIFLFIFSLLFTFPPSPSLALVPVPPLPRALASIFLHPLISAVPVHILHTVYISLLSLARQPFTNCLPSPSLFLPRFIVSSIKSIYNSASLSNCCATKIFHGGSFNSNAVMVSAFCPLLLYQCVVEDVFFLFFLFFSPEMQRDILRLSVKTSVYSFNNPPCFFF